MLGAKFHVVVVENEFAENETMVNLKSASFIVIML